MADCLIGLGSNIGDRTAQLDQATDRLCDCLQSTRYATSSYHETAPIGGPSGQGPFLNAAVRITTDRNPEQVLACVRLVEREMGRERLERWGPRLIDIDVLLYDQLILQTPELTLPHPRMAVRRFVLQSASQVAPDMIHAPTGLPLQSLLARLDEPPCYVAVCCADQHQSAQVVISMAQQRRATVLSSVGERTTSDRWPQTMLRHALHALDQQCELLTSLAATTESEGLFLSDFWVNQFLALARTWPPGPEQTQLQKACEEVIAQVPQPRFTVHLELMKNVDSGKSPRPTGRATTPPQSLETLAAELRRQTVVAGQGPVLCVAAGNLNAALTELGAGIDAMQ